MNKKKIGIAVVVFLLLIGGTVWAFKSRADAQLEKVKQMQKEMAGAPSDQRRERWDDLRKEIDKLTPEQRDKLRGDRWAERERQMDKRVKDYFAASPSKRKEILDKQIADDENRRKQREARRAQGGQGGPGQNPGGPDSSQTGQGQGPNAGGRQGGRNASPDAQSANRNRRLDNSSPAQRAERAAYSSALQKRRLELGLPASNGWGRGGR